MVAYSFKARFAEPILSGAKRQTIRGARKRHARVGEELQLYTGMRTTQCRLIARRRCIDVRRAWLDFPGDRIVVAMHVHGFEDFSIDLDGEPREFDGRDFVHRNAFARMDGFDDWRDMRDFWAREHPGLLVFHGVLIRWAP